MSGASTSPPPGPLPSSSRSESSPSVSSTTTPLDNSKIQFLTDKEIFSWESSGQAKVLSIATAAAEDHDLATIIAIIHEIIITCAAEVFPLQYATDFMKTMLRLPLPNIDKLFLHAFSLHELVEPLKKLILSLDIDKSLLLLLLDPSTLIGLGLTNQMFERKIVRTNTTLLYKQKRFNLLREESEGYSKLIAEIYLAAYSKNNLQKVDSTASTIVSLIGYFDLDPVKALDVFLDISASNLVAHSPFFIQVLKKSPWWPSIPSKPSSIEDIGFGGNSMAAQLLGFKLYSISSYREVAPENLLMLIAVLIKEGFLSLGAIYPYLDPPDEVLIKLYDQWKSDIEERAFMANSSALAMAAPLTDDAPLDNKPTTQASESHDQPKKSDGTTKYPSYQKTGLLHSLLAVGSIYPALFMLSRYPKIVDPYPEIADLLLKISNYAIDPLYILHGKPLTQENINISVPKLIPTSIHDDLTLTTPHHGQYRRGLVPIPPITDSNPAKFFYEQWNSEIVVATDLEGLQRISEVFIRLTGPLLSRNIELLVKLCRIGIAFCRDERENTSPILEFWIDYARNYILPTISLLEPNPGAIQEIFNLFRLFPFETRYSLYGEWQTVVLKSSPHLKFSSSKAEKDTKNVLKRLSNTNVREMMRKLAKVSYSNPISCFKVFIGQVESYDNLATLVVEAARYFTDMGWDVFPFIIMIQMTSGRGTQQMDGLNDRKWIQSLASFTAKLCRRYTYMDPRPLLLFLLRKLHDNDLSFIIVLRELITQMAGIAQLSNLTTSQVESLGGGSVLRSKVFEAIDDERELVAKAGRRLVESFTSLNIFSEIFILLNQIHQRFIHFVPEDKAHEKVLASRYDDLTHILIQFIEMATYYLDIKVFKANMKPVVELCIDYGVDVPYAFGIWRQYLGEEIRGFGPSTADTTETGDLEHWHPVLRSLIQDIQKLYSEEDWKFLKPGFFVTFWQLSLYDIQCPTEKYQQAEDKLKENIAAMADRIRSAESSNSREINQTAKQYRSQQDQLSQQLSKLVEESQRHALHFGNSKTRLRKEKQYWFNYDNDVSITNKGSLLRQSITKQVLAKCILPRALTSPMDAIFCARFVQLLHSIGTYNFSSLTFYDQLFSDGILYGTLLTCTSYEAENLGLFLSELFAKLMQWRENEKVYEDDGLGKRYVDDRVTFLPGLRFIDNGEELSEAFLLDHKNFKTALEKWNKRTTKSIMDCLKSDVYMHRRNSITLLRNMIEVFPAITTQGWEITNAIEKISKNEVREDLKLVANALLGHLIRRSKSWIELYDFMVVSPEVREQLVKQSAAAKREREKKKRAANKPSSFSSSNGSSATTSTAAAATSSLSTSHVRRDSRSSLPAAVRREEKSSTPSSLPASLPKIPSGPRRNDDSRGPPDSRGGPANIIADSSARQIQGRDSRYPRGGRPTENGRAYHSTISESKTRGSGGGNVNGSGGSAGGSGSISNSKAYDDKRSPLPFASQPISDRRGDDNRSRSGRSTPESRITDDVRSSGNGSGLKKQDSDEPTRSKSSLRRETLVSEEIKEQRKDDGRLANRLKEDSGPAARFSNRASRDSPRDSRDATPKGNDDERNASRRERESERERRNKEREREREKDQRMREREREQHNREREREREREHDMRERERERERDRDRDRNGGGSSGGGFAKPLPVRGGGGGGPKPSKQGDRGNNSRPGSSSNNGPSGSNNKSGAGGANLSSGPSSQESKGRGGSGFSGGSGPRGSDVRGSSDDRGGSQEKRFSGGSGIRRGGSNSGPNSGPSDRREYESGGRGGGNGPTSSSSSQSLPAQVPLGPDRDRRGNNADHRRGGNNSTGGSGGNARKSSSNNGPARERGGPSGGDGNDGNGGGGFHRKSGGNNNNNSRDFGPRGGGRGRDDNERGRHGPRDDRDDRRGGNGPGGDSGGHGGRKHMRSGGGSNGDRESGGGGPDKRRRMKR